MIPGQNEEQKRKRFDPNNISEFPEDVLKQIRNSLTHIEPGATSVFTFNASEDQQVMYLIGKSSDGKMYSLAMNREPGLDGPKGGLILAS